MSRDKKLIDDIDFAIKATGSQDDYSMGMRNGMRYVKGLIDGKEPQYELRWTGTDTISREAAIRIAEQGQIQGYEWQFKELNKLPPVTPAEKPNKWMADDVLNHWIGAEVLDRIRDEIAHLHDWAFDREWVLRIIDKYKAESEVSK